MADKQDNRVHTPEEVLAINSSSSAETINSYLTLMEESEPPRNYLVWSFIACVAALIGKNAVFTTGMNYTVTPNMFVILLGPSGTRKNSAINLTTKLLSNTSIYFGPTDTSAQRHGLMSALTGTHRQRERYRPYTVESGPLIEAMINPRQSSDMFLVAPELGRLFGSGSREMSDFMNDLYDSGTVAYETKAGEIRIKAPLVSLLGATTPSSLATILPSEAAGHGILSRIIFVHETSRYKTVPIPPSPTERWLESRSRLLAKLSWIDQFRGTFTLQSKAEEKYRILYPFVPTINDPRLDRYKDRRAEHLLKVAMTLAALRNDSQIIESDILFGHELLYAIEPEMHHALDFFGRNKAFSGRMLMIDMLRQAEKQTMDKSTLLASAASELNPREAEEALARMAENGEVTIFGNRVSLGTVKDDITMARIKRDLKK